MAAALASKGSIGLRGVLRHKGVLFIGVGWGGFIAENLILSENRQWIIERFGEDNYIRVCPRSPLFTASACQPNPHLLQ